MGGRGAIHLGLAAASLLVIAAAPARAASCAHGDDLVAGLSSADRRAALLCVIGTERGARGLAPVRENRLLTLAAQRHADDMVARGYFGHVTPGGATLANRVGATGYMRSWPAWELGEAIAWAQEPLDTAIEDRTLPRLKTLDGNFSPDSDEALLSYGVSYSIVAMLFKNYGEGKMNIELQGQVITLKNVIVSAQKLSNVRSTQLGVQTERVAAHRFRRLGDRVDLFVFALHQAV